MFIFLHQLKGNSKNPFVASGSDNAQDILTDFLGTYPCTGIWAIEIAAFLGCVVEQSDRMSARFLPVADVFLIIIQQETVFKGDAQFGTDESCLVLPIGDKNLVLLVDIRAAFCQSCFGSLNRCGADTIADRVNTSRHSGLLCSKMCFSAATMFSLTGVSISKKFFSCSPPKKSL